MDYCRICLYGFGYSQLVDPAPIFTTQASADRMNGKGNCSGGVCTDKKGPAKSQAKAQPKPKP